MGAQRRHYTPEFKAAAVQRAASGDATVVEVARELGIRPDRLREWIGQAHGERPRGRRESPPERPLSLDEEVRQLRREVARLREERDILKKAAAFFARDSR